MKITRATLWKVPLKSHETYYMAEGKTCATVDTIVLRLDTSAGIEGWGEVCPIPHYLAAYADGVAPALEYLAPVLIGGNPLGVEALMARLDAFLVGHPYVKSPIDVALWDITAKAAGLPVHALLGGKQSNWLPLYHSITCVEPDRMAEIAKEAYANGMRQFQAKLGADSDWRADVERLVKVREAVGDGPLVYGDWNCGSTQLDATRVGRAVAHLDIMLEQPCKTLEECAEVKRACGLTMKIDELAFDTPSLLKASQLGCLDAVALKLSKFGGLSALRRSRDLCLHLGAKMVIEDTWGSDIATAAAVHLAAATPAKSVMNVCDLSHYVGPRLDPNAPSRKDGRIVPSDEIGLGVEPDLDVLGEPILVVD